MRVLRSLMSPMLMGSGMMSGGALGWLDWVIIAAIPLLAVALAMLTARMTVLAALRRML